MWCGTMNLNRGGVSKSDAILSFLQDFECQVLCLQEVNLNRWSSLSYIEDWRCKGFSCLLGNFDDDSGLFRVAIISRWPIRQVFLSDISSKDRYCAGVIEVARSGGIEKIVICTIYAPVGNDSLAGSLTSEVVAALAALTDQWLLLGDFNTTQDSPGVGKLLSTGAAFALDEAFEGQGELPGTFSENRRIDFGLSSHRLHAIEIDHAPGVGDHLAVRYQFNFLLDFESCRQPRRSTSFASDKEVGERFRDCWSASSFEAALERDGDEAWQILSNCAEQSIFLDCAGATLRSQFWSPRVVKPRNKGTVFDGDPHSVRLHRLYRRMKHLANFPLDDKLREKIHRDVCALTTSFPALNAIGYFDAELHVELVADIVGHAAEAYKRFKLQEWTDRLKPDPQRQGAWLKKKSRRRSLGLMSMALLLWMIERSGVILQIG